MKILTNKNKIRFESREEMEQYIEDNELICLGQVGNRGRCSYINHKTEHTFTGHICNFYVIDIPHLILIKHPRLLLYYQDNGGWYVKSQGEKCWINSFYDRKTDMFLTVNQVIENLKKERGM